MKSSRALSLGLSIFVGLLSEISVGAEESPAQGPIYGYATGCEHSILGGRSFITLQLYKTEQLATKSLSSPIPPDQFLTIDGGPGYQFARVASDSGVRRICQKIRSTVGRDIIAVVRNENRIVTTVIVAGETMGSDAYLLKSPEEKKLMDAWLAEFLQRDADNHKRD